MTDDLDPLLARVSFDYRWAGPDGPSTKPSRWSWPVPRVQLDALRAIALPRVPCERTVPIGPSARRGCTAEVMQPEAVKVPRGPIEAREQICPRTLSAPLNPDVVGLDPSAVARALRPAYGSWNQATWTSNPANGEVEASYALGDAQVKITVRDMIHECTGEDAASTLLETEHQIGEFGLPWRVMSATSAVVIRIPYQAGERPQRMVMWVAGRCRVTVLQLNRGLSDDDFAAVGHVVDIPSLEAVCAARVHR